MAAEHRRKGDVYQLKVTLKGVRPPIWRRVLLPGNVTLHRLHLVLQEVVGWTNSHLYVFHVRGERYSEPDADWMLPVKSSRRTRLAQVAGGEGFRFTYEYDLGDSWEHDLLVEKVLPEEPGKRYPVCVAGRRACPPEDCGGVPGYVEFLEALADPQHEGHGDVLEWVGGSFDPEAFSLEVVNEGLRSLHRWAR